MRFKFYDKEGSVKTLIFLNRGLQCNRLSTLAIQISLIAPFCIINNFFIWLYSYMNTIAPDEISYAKWLWVWETYTTIRTPTLTISFKLIRKYKALEIILQTNSAFYIRLY